MLQDQRCLASYTEPYKLWLGERINSENCWRTTMAQILYPCGPGASEGPVPAGYVEVHRWVDMNEVRKWMSAQGTIIPPDIGAGGRVYVTLPGAPKPGGTGPCRNEFFFPRAGLFRAGSQLWLQIVQPVANTPIYNVKIYVP